MIAQRHQVNAVFGEFLMDLLCGTRTARRVFGIGDDTINLVAVFYEQISYSSRGPAPGRDYHDITNTKNL